VTIAAVVATTSVAALGRDALSDVELEGSRPSHLPGRVHHRVVGLTTPDGSTNKSRFLSRTTYRVNTCDRISIWSLRSVTQLTLRTSPRSTDQSLARATLPTRPLADFGNAGYFTYALTC
jgi:hypothetical protein